MLTHDRIRIGDVAQFPLDLREPERIYRYRWEAIAFRPDGSIVARRRHDGLTKTVGARLWAEYAIDEPHPARGTRQRLPTSLPKIRPCAGKYAPDPRPGCYYVTVTDPEGHPGRYVALLGPYALHADALANVGRGRQLAEQSGDPRACWYAYGTARVETPLSRVLFGQ